jgi:hypothetical protein
MQVPVVAGVDSRVHMSEPIRCAVSAKPTPASRHKKELLRYLVLVIALVAVSLLSAIALYYTQGNSVTIEHVSSLAPNFSLRV